MVTGMIVAIRSFKASEITSISGKLRVLKLLTSAIVHTLPTSDKTEMTSREAALGRSISPALPLQGLVEFVKFSMQLAVKLLTTGCSITRYCTLQN